MELVKILLLEMAVFVVCWFLLAKKTDLGNKIYIKIESLDNRVIMLAMFILLLHLRDVMHYAENFLLLLMRSILFQEQHFLQDMIGVII